MFYRGCKGINSNLYQGNNGVPYFRIMNGVYGGEDVDIYINGNLIVRRLKYKQISPYFSAVTGRYNIKVFPSGRTEKPYSEVNICLNGGQILNLAIVGIAGKVSIVAINEGALKITCGNTRIRFANLAYNIPDIDIVIPDITRLFRNIRNGEITDYTRVQPGTYTFNACESGTNHVLASLTNVNLSPNNYYTAYVLGVYGRAPRLEAILVSEPR